MGGSRNAGYAANCATQTIRSAFCGWTRCGPGRPAVRGRGHDALLSSSLEHEAPKPFGIQGQRTAAAMERGGEHHPLQPTSPGEAPAKGFIAIAGDSLMGGSPIDFTFAVKDQGLYRYFGRFKGHGHTIPR